MPPLNRSRPVGPSGRRLAPGVHRPPPFWLSGWTSTLQSPSGPQNLPRVLLSSLSEVSLQLVLSPPVLTMISAMKNAPHPDRGRALFPHFHPKYKCCCDTVHVKVITVIFKQRFNSTLFVFQQGTLMIGIVCSIFTVFGLFSTIFSKDAVYVVVFEVCI